MNLKSLKQGHFFFTSESVTEGHPDKLCDSISDSILDACLEQDPYSRVACEAVTKSNMVLIAGEITSSAKIDIDQIVRNRIKEVGYDDECKGMDYKTCDILLKVTQQSSDINQTITNLILRNWELETKDLCSDTLLMKLLSCIHFHI